MGMQSLQRPRISALSAAGGYLATQSKGRYDGSRGLMVTLGHPMFLEQLQLTPPAPCVIPVPCTHKNAAEVQVAF